MERDWNGANILIRELGRVFPAISAFRLELAGYALDVPQSAVTALDCGPGKSGSCHRQLRIYLLGLSAEGRVRLFLEPIDDRYDASDPITLVPGEAIDWKGIHLRHPGW